MKTVIIIPARFDSSRFPGKPLTDILGLPMIIRVADICNKIIDKSDIYIATDNNQILNVAEQYGYNSILTSKNCLTGTDRVAEATKKVNADIFINVQGDEPTINPQDIFDVVNAKKKYPDFIINAFHQISKRNNPEENQYPKVVMNEKNHLLYVSRSLIPGLKDKQKIEPKYYRQVCIYAFSKDELDLFLNFGRKSELEKLEDIEILRFFELDKKVFMVPVKDVSIAVDYPSDVKEVEEYILKNS